VTLSYIFCHERHCGKERIVLGEKLLMSGIFWDEQVGAFEFSYYSLDGFCQTAQTCRDTGLLSVYDSRRSRCGGLIDLFPWNKTFQAGT